MALMIGTSDGEQYQDEWHMAYAKALKLTQLYENQNGQQKDLKNDRTLEQFGSQIDEMAKGLTDEQVSALKKWYRGDGGEPSKEDEAIVRAFKDRAKDIIKELPDRVEKDGTIHFYNWNQLFMDRVLDRHKEQGTGAELDKPVKMAQNLSPVTYNEQLKDQILGKDPVGDLIKSEKLYRDSVEDHNGGIHAVMGVKNNIDFDKMVKKQRPSNNIEDRRDNIPIDPNNKFPASRMQWTPLGEPLPNESE